jgi:RNA polymerase sigma-70 factor (ECF subfamily)
MDTPRANVEGPDESDLVARLKAKDERAYETLVRANASRLLVVAKRLLRNDSEAAEAVQEAFVSAFQSIDGFAGKSKLSTWLHRITINAALMRIRLKARQHEESLEGLLPTYLDDGHQANPATAWPPDAHEGLEGAEMRAMVRKCIDRLPASYRTVLVLRDIEELDTDETARILGVNANIVKVRLHRARQALRTLLDAHVEKAPR